MTEFPYLTEPQVEELEEYNFIELTDELMEEMFNYFHSDSEES